MWHGLMKKVKTSVPWLHGNSLINVCDVTLAASFIPLPLRSVLLHCVNSRLQVLEGKHISGGECDAFCMFFCVFGFFLGGFWGVGGGEEEPPGDSWN